MIPAAFEYERAGSVEEAIELLGRDEDAKVLAGGQSLIPLLRLRFVRPSCSSTSAGSTICATCARTATGSRSGRSRAMRSSSRDPVLAKRCAVISDAAEPSATRRCVTAGRSGARSRTAIRPPTSATILLTLDADLVARGPGGERTIPAVDFFLGPFMTSLAAREVLTRSAFPGSSEAST